MIEGALYLGKSAVHGTGRVVEGVGAGLQEFNGPIGTFVSVVVGIKLLQWMYDSAKSTLKG